MASRGGQSGNKNATKNKPWSEALRKALIQFEDKKMKVARGAALDKIAETVVRSALAGEKDAWEEIANRLDGKPRQEVDATVSGDLSIAIIRFSDKPAE